MMTIYTWQDGGLKESSGFTESCWINLCDPSTAELEQTRTFSGVAGDFLTDPLDREERPRFESEDGACLFIVHVPCPVRGEEGEENILPYETVPLGIVLFGNSVITICSQRTPVTGAFLDQIRRVCPPCEQNRFAARLLWHSAVLFLRYLRDIHNKTEQLEDELHESISNDVLLKLLTYQKSLVYFTTSLKADNILMRRIKNARQLHLSEDDKDFMEDAEVEYQQAQETAFIHSNILNGTLDTFASLINNNMNKVMKYLTVAMMLMALPTLITSAYGMNIALPLQDHPHCFTILVLVSLLLGGIIGAILFHLARKRVF
ncbi:MAG: magnesium transporter CorA family protein [Kiritimatiellae bacterium]|nr:magnesium transporter CorA family protein [Kiritimatiellia bacterium]